MLGGLTPAIDRSSDLQASRTFLLAVASQLTHCEPVLLNTAVVPAYRCGTVPDSHRIPLVDGGRSVARIVSVEGNEEPVIDAARFQKKPIARPITPTPFRQRGPGRQ